MEQNKRLTIVDWAEEDRPREKMMQKGISSLSDAELLAILIGSGNKDETAVELSARILRHSQNNLNELGLRTVKELITNFKGVGEAKAITIVAAMELGRRRNKSEAIKREQITESRHIFDIFHPLLSDEPCEQFWMLLLNRANKIIEPVCISRGGVAGTVVDTKVAMKAAIDKLADAVAFCHNHPSGNMTPSTEDKLLTKKLYTAFSSIDIRVLDHIIVAGKSYFSFSDEGLM